MKKILLACILVAAIVLAYMLFSSKSAVAPNAKDEEMKTSQQENQKKAENALEKQAQPQATTNPTNEKKPMELGIEVTKEGTGDRMIKAGDHIFVHYTGKLTDGTVFDSSVTRGVPFDFTIGQGMVIAGWEQGFIGAKVGEKRTFTIPSELGYGARGAGAVIPPNATLIFDVEVVDIR